MKKKYIIRFAILLAVLLTFTACNKKPEENRTVIKEPGKSITIIENEQKDTEPTLISVEKIEKFDGMEITDWYDEHTVVLAKENSELGKMSLLEKSEFYPRSIYLYDLDTKGFQTVKAEANMFLGGAKLSPNKKYLLYYEYSIGDTAHYLMNMDETEPTPVKDNVLGTAMTTQWADTNQVVGGSYAGGVYLADTYRNMTLIPELEGQIYMAHKVKDIIYYITVEDTLQLYSFNLVTKEKKNLNIEDVIQITPSLDGKQLLIRQGTGSTRKLLVADADGNVLRTIAEGTEVRGASWSPDQLRIAYQLKTVSNGIESNGLYLYDVLSGESIQIAVGSGYASISWSPSGTKIAVFQFDENNSYNSIIIHLHDEAYNQSKDMGYIMAVDTEKQIIAVDRVELLFSSDEERLAELNIKSEDLITGFMIYNEVEKVEMIKYDNNISVELLDGTTLNESNIGELEKILLQHKLLCNITLKEDIVVRISEQYTP